MAAIGIVKGLDGTFYVENKDGSIKILKFGDEISQGDRVYGVGSNGVSSSLEIAAKDDTFIVAGTNTLVFDISTDENTFGNEEVVFKNYTWLQAETSISSENIVENKDNDNAEVAEETIESQHVQSSDDVMDEFSKRDLENINIETSPLLQDSIELDNHTSSSFMEKDLFEVLELNNDYEISSKDEKNNSLYQLESKNNSEVEIQESYTEPLTITFDGVENGEKIVITLLSTNNTSNSKDYVATVSISNGLVVVDDNSNGAYTITATNSEGIQIEQSETLTIRHNIIGDFFDEQDLNLYDANSFENNIQTAVTTSDGNVLYSDIINELDFEEIEILEDDDTLVLEKTKNIETEINNLNELDGFDSSSIFQFDNLSFDLGNGSVVGTFDLKKISSMSKKLDTVENNTSESASTNNSAVDVKLTSDFSKTQKQ